MTEGQRDRGMERRRDGETEGWRNKETERHSRSKFGLRPSGRAGVEPLPGIAAATGPHTRSATRLIWDLLKQREKETVRCGNNRGFRPSVPVSLRLSVPLSLLLSLPLWLCVSVDGSTRIRSF